LVIEVDGSQHADSSHDRRRNEYMRQQGFSVLRFWNTDILKHRGSVCETILAATDAACRKTSALSIFGLPTRRRPVHD
jgi:very-short-patch-repair endonuclease